MPRGIASRRTRRARSRMWRQRRRSRDWIHAARRMLKSGGALTLIWRADGIGEVLGGARPRLRQPCNPARSCRRGSAGQSAFWFAPSRAGGRRRASMPGLMLNDEPGVPNKRGAGDSGGEGRVAASRCREAYVLSWSCPETRSRGCCGSVPGCRSGADVRRIAANRVPISSDQQIDLHVILRCALAAHLQCKMRSGYPMTPAR